MRWQWQFLAGIAVTASGFLVEAVFLTIMESLHATKMLGKSCNLLADGMELLTFGVVAMGNTGGVREGTVICALLIGTIAGVYFSRLSWLTKKLFPEDELDQSVIGGETDGASTDN